MLLEIQGNETILEMDWLAKHKATIDCETKLLTLVTLKEEKLVYKGTNHKQDTPIIPTTRAFKTLKKGCLTYLCTVEVVETQEPDPGEIPVVQEFLGVFQEVPGLPLDREIEFMIELVPDTMPISKAPYRMAPAELAELKAQL